MTSAKDEQRERRAVLRNDRRIREPSAYIDHTHDDASGGRFAKVARSTVTGADPVPLYPRQPANSPWANDPIGQEPSLGYPIDEHLAVGTEAEIIASLREAHSDHGDQPSSFENAPPSGDARSGTGHPSSDVVAPSLSSRRKGRAP